MSYNILEPKKIFLDPQKAFRGPKYAKIAQKLTNFQVLELQQATGGSDKVAFVMKKFHLDEMKIVCDKNFFLKSHPRGLRAQNYQKGAIFGNFSSVYNKNHPEEKFCNGFACYPSKSLRGQPRNHFKQNLRSLSPFVRFLQDFETSATL